MANRREVNKTFWCALITFVLLALLYLTSRMHQNVSQTEYLVKAAAFESASQESDAVSDLTDVTHANILPINREHSLESSDASTTTKSTKKPTGMNESAKRPMGLPNVIYALADDLGWGDVEYNNGNAHTPNLNEMARSPNTVLLQRYYSGAPICSPTRGTMLTGRNHNRYCLWTANVGFNSPDFTKPQPMPLPLSEITVAEVMREAGYSTALFGKWHLGDFKKLNGGNEKWPVSHPGLHGFDQWQATERSTSTCTTNCGCFQGSKCMNGHYGTNPSCTNYYTNKSDIIVGWPEPVPEGDSHFIWSLAENYIREQVKANKPFFLFLPFHAVHIRYITPERYKAMYQDKQYDLNHLDYYGTISEMDDVMGKLRKLLKELDIHSNTLLWFSSDNGPQPGTPGVTNGLRGAKFSLYEGGVRVPGMIEWPDVITSNKVSSFPVVTSDLLPTVYDILDIKPVDNRLIDGISILPFLQGKVEQRNHSIYWAYQIPGNFNTGKYQVSVSGDRYKLIATYYNGKVMGYELYDLISDLGEKTNLSKKFLSISNKLLSKIESWRQSVIVSAKKVGCL